MFTAEGNSDPVEPGGRTVVFFIPGQVQAPEAAPKGKREFTSSDRRHTDDTGCLVF